MRDVKWKESSDTPGIGRRRLRACAFCAVIVLSSSALASCGDDERTSAITALTTATDATRTTDAPPTTSAPRQTVTSEPTTTTPPATVTGPDGSTTTEIGPADGEAIRVPAEFEISRNGVTPSRIQVPAFLTIALKATSKDGRAHTLRIAGPKGPITLAVPAGGSGAKDVEGLPDGEYLIALDGQATDGALVVGGEPGP
ncbi:hypothetical protein [Paraconexibacter sp.]|uniref:hypothetical protein n=1 Tax=Paraconexibacter sp. TaxID=2949640 RepID=UPI0035652B12